MDTHPIPFTSQDAWAILALVQAKPTEEISRYIWGTKLNRQGEALFGDYLTLLFKVSQALVSLDKEDPPPSVDVEFELKELWTLAFAVTQTSYPGARKIILKVFAGIAALTGLPPWEEPLYISPADMEQIAKSFAPVGGDEDVN